MRKTNYSRKTRHIVKFSSMIAATLFNCATSLAEDEPGKTLVAIPTGDMTQFVYNGEPQTFSIADNENYSVFGNTHTTAGAYEVTVTLNNSALCTWEDGSTESKTYSFVINKSQVEIPAADESIFTYDGKQQTYNIADNELYTAEGIRKTNAGNHEVIVALNDTVNYEWADNTVADKTYNFVIGRASVEIPAADTSKFTYNGATQVYAIKPSVYYNIKGNAQTNAGMYVVNVELENENYQWTDGTTTAKAYNFEIGKVKVELPTASGDSVFLYDGKIKLFDITPNEHYIVNPINVAAVEIGTYDRTVYITDTDNYMWVDNTIEAKKLTFVITEGIVKEPEITDFTYTGRTIDLVPQHDSYSIINGQGLDAGEYFVTIVPNKGYTWVDGTIESKLFAVKINPIYVEKPTVNLQTVTYDSTTYTMTIPESPAYIISGYAEGTEPGTYTSTLTLKPNYIWSDSTTDAVSYDLVIERIKVVIPEEDTTIFYYNQKEQTFSITNSDQYTVEGNVQKEIGEYTVAVTLKDTVHYQWADGTVAPRNYQFEIAESIGFDFELDEMEFTIYPGESIEIPINIDGLLQYFSINSDGFPELKDSLIEFDNAMPTIKIPSLYTTMPGKHKVNVTLKSGNIEKAFSVDVNVNYPASAIIVCWNDVIAVDKTVVNTTTYQWYKDGELIPGATGQYYSDDNGLCGLYSCVVDGGLIVGPTYLDFGKPVYLTAHGEVGKIIASAASSTAANVLLMSINGEVIDSKPVSTEMEFTVKAGVYVLALEGTDKSVVVIVR
ncbi:MAG: hypothetical protein MJY63_04630 [Paludibacteraceae bacterium]|nr:hypothetical protein [Paludibacteraceae bacterium]